MTTKSKILIICGSTVLLSAIGYYIYTKITIDKINKKVTPLDEALQQLNAIKNQSSPRSQLTVGGGSDTLDYDIHPLNSVDSNLAEFENDEYGVLVENNWDQQGGYKYVFNDGSSDFYRSDDTFFGSYDANNEQLTWPD